MKNEYICPACRGNLNVRDYIVFSASVGKGNYGLIFLSPDLGDYKSIKHPSFIMEEGEHIDFFCPICHVNLLAKEISKNLARVLMIDDKNNEYEILFSDIAGEKCTYKIHDTEVESYGVDSQKYMNFFGATPNY